MAIRTSHAPSHVIATCVVRPLVDLRSLPPRCNCSSWGASAPPLPLGPRPTVAIALVWQANPGPAVPLASPRGDPIRSDPACWSSSFPSFSDGIGWDQMGSIQRSTGLLPHGGAAPTPHPPQFDKPKGSTTSMGSNRRPWKPLQPNQRTCKA